MASEQRTREAELVEQVESLQAEIADLRERDKAIARSAVAVGGRLLLGRPLRSSFRAWLKAKTLRDPLPADETAGVLAAIVRRVVRVGLVGLLVAALPAGFLLWQSLLMSKQNKEIGRQIDLQAADTLIVRRAQLLATIYEEDCEPGVSLDAAAKKPEEEDTDSEPEQADCQPRSHPRARQEAVVAFMSLERNRSVRPNLAAAKLSRLDLNLVDFTDARLVDADLSGATLFGANLNGVNLRGANLINARLNGAQLSRASLLHANLSGANLGAVSLFITANLSGANLSGANLSLADLHGANLRGASLIGADLSGTNLIGVDLSGATLSYARGLTQSQLDQARGIPSALPPKLTPPG